MNKTKSVFLIILFFLVGLVYNYKYFNYAPSHIHAWAQADRYALSLGFLDNNLNFFKPQTLIYNHQFPDFWKTAGEYRTTAVDFPIHDYIPALLMKLSGSLLFSAELYRKQAISTILVIKINSSEKHVYYREFNLQNVLKAENEWQLVSLMFRLPKIETENVEFSVYFWNPGKSELLYDDIKLEVY